MIYRTLPDIHSKYFTLKSAGGYYGGIAGNLQLFNGSALNNCTAGAWGLFAMQENNPSCGIGGRIAAPYDAKEWFKISDGYKHDQTPEEGAIICFENHVAFINEILDNGDIVIIESGYGSKNTAGLWKKTLTKSSGYYRGKIYGNVVGFIHPKHTPERLEMPLEDAIERIAREVLKGTYGNGEARKNALYKAIQGKVNEICRN